MSSETSTKTRDPGAIWTYALPALLFLTAVLTIVGAPSPALVVSMGAALGASIGLARCYRDVFATLATLVCTTFFVLTMILLVADIIRAVA